MLSTHVAPIAASQFFQGLFCPLETAATDWLPLTPLPTEAQGAITTLLDLVRTLCAPDSGWPADQPLTPEQLLPYVTDEAEELREALQHWAAPAPTGHEPPANSGPEAMLKPPELLADLSTFLLWAIAASTPIAMDLLEGIAATLTPSPAAHGVRLVPVLHLQLEEASYALDLSTQTHFDAAIRMGESTVLQLPDSDLPAMTLAEWREYIWPRMQAIAPRLQPWQQGTPLQVLLPGQTWTMAQASLSLEFVPLNWAVTGTQGTPEIDWYRWSEESLSDLGQPSVRVWTAEPADRAALDTAIVSETPGPLTQRCSGESDVLFEDEVAWQRVIAPMAIESIGYPRYSDPRPHPDLQQERLHLVETVFAVAQAQALAGGPVVRSPLSLMALCHHLKWLWIRASQTLMPLMSGVSARRLSLEQPWELGTLATRGQLLIQSTAIAPAVIDVSTGEWQTAPPALQDTDIVHLQSPTGLPQELWRVGDLTTYLNAQIQPRSSVLAYLMHDVPVRLTSPHDALFPEATENQAALRFQIVIDFSSNLR
jgi:hypothetical protein